MIVVPAICTCSGDLPGGKPVTVTYRIRDRDGACDQTTLSIELTA